MPVEGKDGVVDEAKLMAGGAISCLQFLAEVEEEEEAVVRVDEVI